MKKSGLHRFARNDGQTVIILLAVSAVIRAILAGWIELGTDEAYYWTFAKYPDWSHFDHPGMVGWMIQLFTLNLRFDSEFFMRLASVVFMTINTWVMYRIGRELKDEATGLWAALLYTASVYAFVITGVFILPDTPLNLFGLLGFWHLIKHLHNSSLRATAKQPNQNCHCEHSVAIGSGWVASAKGLAMTDLLLAGVFIGLSILSKYTGAFLWAGFLLYSLCFDRRQFKNPWLYVSMLITALCCLPIVLWNVQNDWVSFRFHGDRVGLFGALNLGSFGAELGGELLYNNPVNVIVVLLAVVAAFRKKLSIDPTVQRLLLLTALPMIGLFWAISLTRNTLPHWTGPAYTLLILLSAVWLSGITTRKARRIVAAALGVLALILVIGVSEIKTGFVPLDRHTEPSEVGHDDITLDLYGWRQAASQFAAVREEAIARGEMRPDDALIGHKWFPMASFHYYAARPLNLPMLGYGPLENIHKYRWINRIEGGFEKGRNYWYLADSRYFIDPNKVYAYTNFHEIKLIATIPIERHGKTARNIFVYECKGLVYGPEEE